MVKFNIIAILCSWVSIAGLAASDDMYRTGHMELYTKDTSVRALEAKLSLGRSALRLSLTSSVDLREVTVKRYALIYNQLPIDGAYLITTYNHKIGSGSGIYSLPAQVEICCSISYSIDILEGEIVLDTSWRYFPSTAGLQLRQTYVIEDTNAHRQFIIDERDQRNPITRYVGKDTTVQVFVYLPDPVTAGGVSYGAPGFADNEDANTPELTSTRRSVKTSGLYANDSFYLQHPLIVLQDLSLPFNKIPSSLISTFNYTRDQDEFESVNAFYHILEFYNRGRVLRFTLT